MADVTIDRLALKLSGLSEEDGRHLAELIAQELAGAALSEAPARRVGAVSVKSKTESGEGLDDVARRVVADVIRQLQRTL